MQHHHHHHQHAPHMAAHHGHPPYIRRQNPHQVQFRLFPFTFTALSILLVYILMKLWGKRKPTGGQIFHITMTPSHCSCGIEGPQICQDQPFSCKYFVSHYTPLTTCFRLWSSQTSSLKDHILWPCICQDTATVKNGAGKYSKQSNALLVKFERLFLFAKNLRPTYGF